MLWTRCRLYFPWDDWFFDFWKIITSKYNHDERTWEGMMNDPTRLKKVGQNRSSVCHSDRATNYVLEVLNPTPIYSQQLLCLQTDPLNNSCTISCTWPNFPSLLFLYFPSPRVRLTALTVRLDGDASLLAKKKFRFFSATYLHCAKNPVNLVEQKKWKKNRNHNRSRRHASLYRFIFSFLLH